MMMELAFDYLSQPTRCGYLPEQIWQLEYYFVYDITPAEYRQMMDEGWRRFGYALFHPQCPSCTACRPLRILVEQFRPNRSQKRVCKTNQNIIRFTIQEPKVTHDKLHLYDRYHAYQTAVKGWPEHLPKDPESYFESFVDNPFPVQEWCYYHQDRLVGVGYVDVLPEALSAIYFFYDPEYRPYSLGTWNVLSIIDYAQQEQIPYLYLGYYVANCQSMEYKATFRPNQLLNESGQWVDFRK